MIAARLTGVFAAGLLALSLAGAAHAQMVARAEHGAIPLIMEPQEIGETITVARGGVAIREKLRPRYVARMLEDAVVRPRPGPLPGAQEGELLYGVRLQTGFAYCQLIDNSAPNRSVQCYRDFNADSHFDGGYVTRHDGFASQVIPSLLQQLAGIPRVPYERVSSEEFGSVDAHWIFDRWHRGNAQFRMVVEGERLNNRNTCEPIEDLPGLCNLAGLALRITQEGNGARITIEGQADRRHFMIITSGVL